MSKKGPKKIMEKIYSINLLLICLSAISSDVVYCSISRLNKTITNVEVKLDTVNNDIAAFRLDMIDIREKMEDTNKTMCPKEKANGSKKMTDTKPKSLVESHVSEKKLYSAFKSEKRLVRGYSQSFKENINVLEKGQKHIEALVNKQTENIEKIVQDIEILNSTNIFKNVLTGAIGEVSQNIQTTDDKVFALEHAQENMAENMKTHEENIKTAIQDKESLVKNLKKMDQLESEMKTLKVTLDNVMNQMKTVQLALDVLKDRTSCSPPWHRYGESCYYFSADKLSWRSAKNYCSSKDSYLADYKGVEEVKAIARLALSISPNGYYWIGVSDISNENSWIWSKSGGYVNFNYWLPNNPDNYRGEDCVVTDVNQQGRWNDYDCDAKLTFICKKK